MKIKIKYIVKWFILLFPLILTFIYLIRNNFHPFDMESEFFSYLYCVYEESSIGSAIMRIIEVFIPNSVGMVYSSNNLEIMILCSFAWFLQTWFFWEFCELISHFYHKLTNQGEE